MKGTKSPYDSTTSLSEFLLLLATGVETTKRHDNKKQESKAIIAYQELDVSLSINGYGLVLFVIKKCDMALSDLS